MRRNRHFVLAMAAVVALVAVQLLLFAAAGTALLGAVLDPAPRDVLLDALGTHAPLLVMVAAAVSAIALLPARIVYRRWVAPVARLQEQARVLLTGDGASRLQPGEASQPLQALAASIDDIAAQRDQLRRDIAAEVARASSGIEQERNRLAALMGELTQSVVVCNLDGRVLLYNNRARLQFKALTDTTVQGGGAELIGLGRSIYAVFERTLVAHALERVQQRLERGAAQPTSQFVTVTRSGQLLRAHVAPVRAVDTAGDPAALAGFVLMLDNMTQAYEEESARERLLHGLTEGSRGSLANLQMAAEMLGESGLDDAMRGRFLRVVREEAQAMTRRINELASQNAEGLTTRWPLEEMLGSEVLQAAQRRLEGSLGLRVGLGDVDRMLWLKVDSFSLLQMLTYLAQRLRDEFGLRSLHLRLGSGEARRARLDLVWSGQSMSTETVMSWEIDPMTLGSERSSLTVRDVVQRHGGEFWFERDRVRHEGFFRILLPLAPSEQWEPAEPAGPPHGSRPEYYDFDLLGSTESTHALDDRPLTELRYTVFDTETTGLDPRGGHEILQIGATRVVNGRLLRSECFDQLVDPQRTIPAASIPIHGITPERVAGMPKIDEVLRAFHGYADDSVLVGHNSAFDLRFLQLKEASSGVRFDHPVLDTLLLSAVVHPNQTSHRLEDIAQRFGVMVVDRHTALGDALVTAQVFLHLIPLLAERGICTLGQAREASQRTYFARLKY